MEAHYGVAYTRPFEPCQIDAFGDLSAVAWNGAYPATGKARSIPQWLTPVRRGAGPDSGRESVSLYCSPPYWGCPLARQPLQRPPRGRA